MKMFNTVVEKYYHPYFGIQYKCYKDGGKLVGNVAHVNSIWEVIKFILM